MTPSGGMNIFFALYRIAEIKLEWLNKTLSKAAEKQKGKNTEEYKTQLSGSRATSGSCSIWSLQKVVHHQDGLLAWSLARGHHSPAHPGSWRSTSR